jgi:anti-sigma regulatory factor (Ser/Thr protein kinase)
MAGVELLVDPLPRSVPMARRWLTDVLGASPRVNVDIARLLLSEILTNAILHARTTVTVRVIEEDGCLRVEAIDAGADDRPTSRPRLVPTNLSEDGRGLQIVDMLAARWGTGKDDDERTVVWFELAPAEDRAYALSGDISA